MKLKKFLNSSPARPGHTRAPSACVFASVGTLVSAKLVCMISYDPHFQFLAVIFSLPRFERQSFLTAGFGPADNGL
jgi:hypothetical protein